MVVDPVAIAASRVNRVAKDGPEVSHTTSNIQIHAPSRLAHHLGRGGFRPCKKVQGGRQEGWLQSLGLVAQDHNDRGPVMRLGESGFQPQSSRETKLQCRKNFVQIETSIPLRSL